MAKKKSPRQVPGTVKNFVQDLGNPVSSSDVDSYGKLKQIQDRSHQVRTIVKAWKDQQTQDRQMRERYATYLIVAMGLQSLVVNGVFVLMGWRSRRGPPGRSSWRSSPRSPPWS